MTASASDPVAMGIYIQDGLALQCPLTSIAVEGNVTGMCVHMTVTQTYVNADDHPIEAVYIFPLSDEAIVTGLEIRIGDRRARGEVIESEAAFEEYDEAVWRGDLAALLEQRRPNIFEISVGNIQPQETVTIAVTTTEELAWRDNAVQLRIPTVVGSRYIPGQPTGQRDGYGRVDPTGQVPDADHITPPVVEGETPYRVKIRLDFEMPAPIERVSSPTHELVVERPEPHRATVTLLDEALPDRDVVIDCAVKSTTTARLLVDRTKDAAEGVFLWTFQTDFPKPPAMPKEVVFLIDHSGSMMGRKMDQARTALRLCLRSLDEGDKFNIIRFNDSYRAMHKGTVTLTQETLEQADAWVREIESSGGTELLPAFQAALHAFGDAPGFEQILVLLTDAEVGNDREIVREARRAGGRARIFAFGIDSAVNSWLLRELASTSAGAVEFITPDERVDEKVLRQFAQIKTPLLREVEVEWKGVKVDAVYPKPPLMLFWGQPLTLLGRFSRASDKAAVTLRGRAGEELFEATYDLDFSQSRTDAAVRLCWARRHLKSLEAALADASGRRARAARKRLLDFALEYELASSVTSFIAIEEQPAAQGGVMPETRIIPVMLLYAWEQPTRLAEPSMNLLLQEPGALLAFASADHFCPSFERVATQAPPAEPRVPDLFDLAAEQNLDGSWGEGTEDEADILTTSLAVLAFAAWGHTLESDEFGRQLAKAERWLRSRPEPQTSLIKALRDAALRAMEGERVDFLEWESNLPRRLPVLAEQAVKLWESAVG